MKALFKISKNRDLINYGLPYVFIILAVVELIFSLQFESQSRFVLRWIVGVLLFNIPHVLLTFINIFYLPEFRSVLKKQKALFIKHSAVILTLIFLFNTSNKLGFFYSDSVARYALILLLILAPSWHAIRQSLGFSLQINENLKRTLITTGKSFSEHSFTVSRNFEKLAVWSLILCAVPAANVILSNELNFPFSTSIANYLLGFLIFCALLFFALALFKLSDLAYIKKKILFAGRYVIYAIAPFTYIGRIGGAAIHGVEYTLFQEKVFSNSRVTKKVFSSYMWVVLIGLGLYCAFLFSGSSIVPEESVAPTTLIKTVAFVNFTVTYYHYYLDSKLFQMQDPEIRQTMAPLLKNAV